MVWTCMDHMGYFHIFPMGFKIMEMDIGRVFMDLSSNFSPSEAHLLRIKVVQAIKAAVLKPGGTMAGHPGSKCVRTAVQKKTWHKTGHKTWHCLKNPPKLMKWWRHPKIFWWNDTKKCFVDQNQLPALCSTWWAVHFWSSLPFRGRAASKLPRARDPGGFLCCLVHLDKCETSQTEGLYFLYLSIHFQNAPKIL